MYIDPVFPVVILLLHVFLLVIAYYLRRDIDNIRKSMSAGNEIREQLQHSSLERRDQSLRNVQSAVVDLSHRLRILETQYKENKE